MKCTSTIRKMAYGADPDALDEYLQMGATTARKSLLLFCKAIMELYGEEFLRKLTYTDMKKLYLARGKAWIFWDSPVSCRRKKADVAAENVSRRRSLEWVALAMLLKNSCLVLIKLFVIWISASCVTSRAYHLDVAMHIAENRIVHTFELILCDVHRMLEMCLCDVARKVVMGMLFHRIVAMGMWFHRIVVMGNGYNSGKCCHTVDVGCRMMVGRFLELLDHVVYVYVQAAQRQMV
ncbi:hypothetical protein Tco_0065185 [Tanacetum coccineum]